MPQFYFGPSQNNNRVRAGITITIIVMEMETSGFGSAAVAMIVRNIITERLLQSVQQ